MKKKMNTFILTCTRVKRRICVFINLTDTTENMYHLMPNAFFQFKTVFFKNKFS